MTLRFLDDYADDYAFLGSSGITFLIRLVLILFLFSHRICVSSMVECYTSVIKFRV